MLDEIIEDIDFEDLNTRIAALMTYISQPEIDLGDEIIDDYEIL